MRAITELANETAGDHFTPREVIRLMATSTPEIDADLKLAEEEILRLLQEETESPRRTQGSNSCFRYGDILSLFIQAPGSLRDLYDRRWISYNVFTGVCLY